MMQTTITGKVEGEEESRMLVSGLFFWGGGLHLLVSWNSTSSKAQKYNNPQGAKIHLCDNGLHTDSMLEVQL